MLTIILFAATLVCGIGWLTNYISLLAQIMWADEKYGAIPTKDEMDVYTRKVVRLLFTTRSEPKS